MSTLMSPTSEYSHPARSPRKRPSPVGYWLAAALAVTGVLAAAIWAAVGFVGYTNHIDGFTRANAPGNTTVSIDDPGTYLVYYESARGATPDDLGVAITDPSGRPVALQGAEYDLRYDVPGRNGRVGTAVAQFRADAAGTYRLSVERDVPDATVAVGSNVTRSALPSLLGAGALALATCAGAVVLTISTAVRRARTVG
jgi:hypothetical protein